MDDIAFEAVTTETVVAPPEAFALQVVFETPASVFVLHADEIRGFDWGGAKVGTCFNSFSSSFRCVV